MKETNILINIGSTLAIINGLILWFMMLNKGKLQLINLDCLYYFLASACWIFGLLVLFRENRSKK